MEQAGKEEATIIEEQHIVLPDAAATLATGARFAAGLRGGMVIGLSGELGAGKTTLVRGMLRGLGWSAPVKSPTYTLVECYEVSSLYFYHFDLYRFTDPREWESSGFADYFGPDTICVIEWPERLGSRLPAIDVCLRLEYAQDARTLTLSTGSEAGSACLAAYFARSR